MRRRNLRKWTLSTVYVKINFGICTSQGLLTLNSIEFLDFKPYQLDDLMIFNDQAYRFSYDFENFEYVW